MTAKKGRRLPEPGQAIGEVAASLACAGEKTLHPTSDRVPGAVLWDASFDARRRPPIGLEASCPRPVEL